MQKYLSIDNEQKCNKTVKFINTDNEFCGTVKFNKDGELKNISDIVPSEANSDNKLVDRKTMEQEIEIADATFRGTYNSFEELPTTGIDKNDYAFVVVSTEDKKTYKKYKWTKKEDSSWGWVFEYDLEIDSKIVPTKISELEDDLKWGNHLEELDSSISNLNNKVDDLDDSLRDLNDKVDTKFIEIDSSISDLNDKKIDVEELNTAAIEAKQKMEESNTIEDIQSSLSTFFDRFIKD